MPLLANTVRRRDIESQEESIENLRRGAIVDTALFFIRNFFLCLLDFGVSSLMRANCKMKLVPKTLESCLQFLLSCLEKFIVVIITKHGTKIRIMHFNE